MTDEKKTIRVSQVVPIRRFAELLGVSVPKILEILFKSGVSATINESVDFETAEIVGFELGFKVIKDEGGAKEKTASKGNLKSRPPVVVIMGHVDHGKTKLLDAIRSTNVIETESGGITQHMGSYQTEIKYKGQKKQITFLDTPGHEAFASIRAQGANVTDMVVLVVAVNDGVKPQTVEAISHAKASGVPIIVALNKIDLPDADVEGTKRQLADVGLLPEEWGGKIPMVQISAKKKINIEGLLEMILLVADLQDLKTNYEVAARGVVIESKMQPGIGPLATVLIQEGILKVGDYFYVADTYGKARILVNFKGGKITEAFPSMPVKIAGLKSMPQVGEILQVALDEKEAKKLASESKIQIRTVRKIQTENKGQTEANLIIRADVQGSLEAILNAIGDMHIPDNEVAVNILNSGLGAVTEGDVKLAANANGIIFAFRVSISMAVQKLARDKNVEIRDYEIIYKLIEELYDFVSEKISPSITHVPLGKMKVLKIFKKGLHGVCGGDVTSGKVTKDAFFKIFREKAEIGTGKVSTLQKENSAANEVSSGSQAGIGFEANAKIKSGDILEFYLIEETARKAVPKSSLKK